jgi:rubredoxin
MHGLRVHLRPDIKPGTAFEDIPDDWRCPLCGAMKKYFEKVK